MNDLPTLPDPAAAGTFGATGAETPHAPSNPAKSALSPGSEQWLLADVVRASRHTAIARLFGDDVLLRPEGVASGHGSRHIASAVPRRLGQLWDAVARRVR